MERISAFIDGEAGQFEAAQAVRRLRDDAVVRESWHLYHRIGDALRGECVLGESFTTRVMAQLAREPVVLAPRWSVSRVTRYALSAAASVAGVAVVAAIAFNSGPTGSGPTAGNDATPPPTKVAEYRPTPGEMNVLLAAHQDYAGGSTIHTLGAYARPVSTGTDVR